MSSGIGQGANRTNTAPKAAAVAPNHYGLTPLVWARKEAQAQSYKTLSAKQTPIIKQALADIAFYQETIIAPNEAIIYNPLSTAGQILTAQGYVSIAQADVTAAKVRLNNAVTLQMGADQQSKDLAASLVKSTKKSTKTSAKSPYTPSSTSIPVPGPSGPPPDTKHLHYHYNAPMVKEAYFSPLGVQANPDGYKGSAEIQVDAGSYQDAWQAWKGVKGGRGTIQMDRASLGSTMKPVADKGSKVDPNLYGFKFLYNPNTVNMSWGITSVVNPTFLQQSLSEASPLALGLIQSNISFSVLLNRIEDFKYLDANGLRAGVQSPYKDAVSPADLKELYKKGTMYDLDYLFKTLMGGSATFVSPLNGTTADRGWLTSIAVELHLGEGLRYRVRVSDLQVAHTMFNSRMVPIMSTASFICTRFYDSATSAADKSTLDTYNSGSLPAKYTTP